MDSQVKILTVHPPIPPKQLCKYAKKKGVFIIRINSQVVYIGNSTNINKAVRRLFQNGGKLEHLDIKTCLIETVFTKIRRPSVERVLKQTFSPEYNHKPKRVIKFTYHEKKQAKRIETEFSNQSRFAA